VFTLDYNLHRYYHGLCNAGVRLPFNKFISALHKYETAGEKEKLHRLISEMNKGENKYSISSVWLEGDDAVFDETVDRVMEFAEKEKE